MINRTQDMQDKALPIHFAAISANESNCKILLKLMSNKQKKQAVNQGDEQGNTPLHMATLRSDLPTIKILENAGADSSIKNKSDETPIDIAKFNEAEEIVAHFD